MNTRVGAAAALLIMSAASAQAQTVLAPSGDSAITQPGGAQGRAGRRNVEEAFRNGDVVVARPLPALDRSQRSDGQLTRKPAGPR
ncbi:hypothetical protein MKK63_12695 [Methylobacterium sp. J-088]|uniref:hypothetical protein n=1 Tax=unclassified Methylobacterium TaxID=2615210 RepID=UPI001FBA1053|nr:MULTISPECIES: hypothetical protein [unclassified Methylobacterium]MCJ2063564.1 hypothetical protein [Methylobacterium sp. J-088]